MTTTHSEKYLLVMFPYPSGHGLHLGHAYNYMISDSIGRWWKLQGHEVFQPFGYDAFGLPAENFARSVGRDPADVTSENIIRFRSQMERMNTNFQETLSTTDENYIRWTQWVFLKMKERGLAYKATGPVNWCSSCETVLANEQVKEGSCERCSTKVETRVLNQWFLKITAYKDRLIKNLEGLDYPSKTKKMQRAWLENLHDWCVSRQRSWGCPIPIEGETDTLDTFVDSSFYWLRYLDPENPNELVSNDKVSQVDLYIGGAEHACMHLIYARFVNMFLFDIGVTPFEEPFKKLFHQGTILSKGSKMSKSKGNVVSPDDYDPDELRLFLMFLGPYDQGGDWGNGNMKGVRRFLTRMRTWLSETGEDSVDVEKLRSDIDHYVDSFKVNKIVSTFMIFLNENKEKKITPVQRDKIISMLKCFSPGFSL